MIALKYMATEKGPESLTSAREICDKFKTPFDTTAKVLQVMNNKGLLSSTKGIKGGYSLKEPLSSITFNELCTMVEGRQDFNRFCESSKGLCDLYDICNIVTPIDALNNKIRTFLDELTLEDLLLNQSQSEPVEMAFKTENA